MNWPRFVLAATTVVLVFFLVGTSPLLAGTGGGDEVSPSSTAPSSDGITVITTQDTLRDRLRSAEIIAFRPNGSVLYYDDSYGTYFDVDPVPNTSATVTYVAAEFIPTEECPAGQRCTRNSLVKTNLSTGETEVLYQRVRHSEGDHRWHDADRINETHYAIADLTAIDRVFIVNVSSELTTWSWEAQSTFNLTSGSGYGRDWSHINDVEVLEDGRIMVSARNQDSVLFIDRRTGVQEDWTLGGEDRYEILHEQHNPDYIPRDDGGPAVLVADSENDRVVEYQRRNGAWERSWHYTDQQLTWPRDADRLPNGHTLITDSNGYRVFEVDESGEVVWSVDVALPYEAERLSTPQESGGGPAAASAGLTSSGDAGDPGEPSGSGGGPAVSDLLDRVVPESLEGAVEFVTPAWMGIPQYVALVLLVCIVVAWPVAELRWSDRIEVRSPVRIRR